LQDQRRAGARHRRSRWRRAGGGERAVDGAVRRLGRSNFGGVSV
jgi:hypothetical protein